jgi:hypothetical protein
MGLMGDFGVSDPPCMMMKLLGDDGLAALINMDVAHHLLPRLVQLGECESACNVDPRWG